MVFTSKIFDNLDKFLAKKNISREIKTVFTNGCFDILHPGHLTYLYEAKQNGDILILGLNSDSSITRLKGSNRPINNFEFRATMLSYLPFVDYIIGFGEDTPLNLIEEIRPMILIKGGDYSKNQVVGHEYVEAYGGDSKNNSIC